MIFLVKLLRLGYKGGILMSVTQEQLDAIIDKLQGISEKMDIMNANDVVISYDLYDPGTSDERIHTEEFHSATIHSDKKVAATYVYGGTSPNYYLETITYSLEDV